MPEKNSTTLSFILVESVVILLDSVFANSGRLLRVLIKFGAYKSNKEGGILNEMAAKAEDTTFCNIYGNQYIDSGEFYKTKKDQTFAFGPFLIVGFLFVKLLDLLAGLRGSHHQIHSGKVIRLWPACQKGLIKPKPKLAIKQVQALC
jgi:hypothetical protein